MNKPYKKTKRESIIESNKSISYTNYYNCSFDQTKNEPEHQGKHEQKYENQRQGDPSYKSRNSHTEKKKLYENTTESLRENKWEQRRAKWNQHREKWNEEEKDEKWNKKKQKRSEKEKTALKNDSKREKITHKEHLEFTGKYKFYQSSKKSELKRENNKVQSTEELDEQIRNYWVKCSSTEEKDSKHVKLKLDEEMDNYWGKTKKIKVNDEKQEDPEKLKYEFDETNLPELSKNFSMKKTKEIKKEN